MLSLTPVQHSLFGAGSVPLLQIKHKTNCILRSRFEPSKFIKCDALVVPKIADAIPTFQFNPGNIQDSNLSLADPKFWIPKQINFLLGCESFIDILDIEHPVSHFNSFKGLNTIFGIVVMGKIISKDNQAITSSCNSMQVFNSIESISNILSEIPKHDDPLHISQHEDLTFLLRKFWSVEECEEELNSHPNDLKCELHFLNTTSREIDGRYVVKLPFKTTDIQLGESRSKALCRLFSLESKFRKQVTFYEHYTQFMTDYINLGHMTKTFEKGNYYIPHHGVWQLSELKHKLRVVFDASSISSNGKCLNDYLFSGPKLQNNIVDILTNFRMHPIVFTSDITKMYRQINIHPEHRKFQFILWRSNPEEHIQTYRLNTVTYGTTSAPYLAQRVIKKLVEDEGTEFPQASQILSDDIYVDDILSGSPDLESALESKHQLVNLLKKGGFELHKWTSNSNEFLNNIGVQADNNLLQIESQADSLSKLLGLYWNPIHDEFIFRVGSISKSVSKRSILSCIARLYDPIGFLSPVIFYAKCILQQLWKDHVDWDEIPSEGIIKQWNSFSGNLNSLSTLTIPRFILPQSSGSFSLVGFCDASEKGYAAVFYLRSYNALTKRYQSFLLRSKTKLAPIKLVTLPRLELCAALLLSKLLISLKPFIRKHSISEIRLFSDATIVLHWLYSSSQKYPTFIANRISFILNYTQLQSWAHVKSMDNPADLPSRGMLPQDILQNTFWWSGPDWLKEPYESWPSSNIQFSPGDVSSGEICTLTVTNYKSEFSNYFIEIISKFSDLYKLLRVISFILKFISRLYLITKKSSIWTSDDHSFHVQTNYFGYGLSFIKLVKIVQQNEFQSEFCYKTNKSLSNRLLKLNAYLDSNQVIRVGGRLESSDLSENQKHPILLTSKSHLARLLVLQYHITYFHANYKLLQALINKRFWILSHRPLLKHVIFSCNICHRLKVKPISPIMANLPSVRVKEGFCFRSVGVDYAGPLYTKESKRRNSKLTKSYIAIFVCMATKAVHVDLVSDLSTAAFLACLDRFVARRGLPKNIYSDCGSNFIGASRQLKDLYTLLGSSDFKNSVEGHLLRQEIKWHFGPPSAPHFGGIWEAAVKSVKLHLYRVLKDHALTFEELSTVLAKIEAILNSRPLCPLTPMPDDTDFLSPGHFLVGRPLVLPPEEDISEKRMSYLNRWHLINASVQHIWRRWSLEYLHTLQQRIKWFKGHSKQVHVDDLVLVIDKGHPPLQWVTGRVSEVYHGKDGIIRVVALKTKSGHLIRPVHKLVHLVPENVWNDLES